MCPRLSSNSGPLSAVLPRETLSRGGFGLPSSTWWYALTCKLHLLNGVHHDPHRTHSH
jgi:hypothetical protein